MSATDTREQGPRGGWARIKHFCCMLIPSLEDIRVHQPIVPPLVAGWIFALVSAVSIRPLLLSSVPAEQAGVAKGMEVLLWAIALAAPLIQLFKAGLLTALGWAVLVLVSSSRRIRPLFSVLLYGEAILAMQGVLLAVVLHFTTGGSVSSPQDLQVSLGPAAFVPPSRPVLMAVAQCLSVFHLVWFAFLLVALRRCDTPEPRPSAALAFFFWGVVIAFAAARSWIAP